MICFKNNIVGTNYTYYKMIKIFNYHYVTHLNLIMNVGP